MKRNLWVMLILTLLASCALAQTQTVVSTPQDVVYVFMRAYVSVDGKGVCDSDEPWRVRARLNRAPDDVWALASRLDTLRPHMMNALTPVIQDCRRFVYGGSKAEKAKWLALCVAEHDWTMALLQAGGVLGEIDQMLNPTRAREAGLRCNGDPCPNGTICDCRKSNPLDPEADCEKVAASCEHSESPTRQITGLTLRITW